MEVLNNLFETFKEKAKAIWAEQMESELVIRLKERFEELPPIGQRGVVFGAIGIVIIVVLWWPVSNLMDASDLNQRFEERRQLLKELLQIQRDSASGDVVPLSPPPTALKVQLDQKIAQAGIKPEQVKESNELPPKNINGAQEQGLRYRLEHLTVRQAVDLGYEMEHTDPSLKLVGLDVVGNDPDPHFYEVAYKLVNYAPKIASAGGGEGIIDTIKKNEKTNGSKTQ